MIINYAALTMKGTCREENLDRVVVAGRMLSGGYAEGSIEDGLLAVVCDGVGSESSAATAAFVAGSCFGELVDEVNPPLSLFRQFGLADEALRAEAFDSSAGKGMATTIAGVYLDEKECIVFNAGDTRVYEISEGNLKQLSDDHTRAQAMVDALFARNAEDLPARSQSTLIRWIGEGNAHGPAFSMSLVTEKGVKLMVCSDGAYRALGEEDLKAAIGRGQDLLSCCKSVYESALAVGSGDDISIIMIERAG